MKLKKRMLGIILSLVLVLGLMPGMGITASAESQQYKLTFTGANGSLTKIIETTPYEVTLSELLNSCYGVDSWTFANASSSDTNYVSIEGEKLVIKQLFEGSMAVTNVQYTYKGTVFNTNTMQIACAPLVHVTEISLDKTSAALTVGDTETLTATVSPDNASDKSVTWSSDNTSVATISNGVITAVAKGTATITATATNGTDDASDDKTATCAVTVEPISYNVTYKVVNGAWDEGDKADRTITLTGENVTLGTANIPNVGTKPDAGYKEGSWDITPTPGTAITGDVTYTYTYVRDISGELSDSESGDSSEDSSDNTNTNTDTSAKVSYDDVAISTGAVNDITGTASATAESNPFGTKIENNSNLTTLLSLTDEEVAQGVNVWLDVQDMSASVSQTDKTLIQNTSGDYTVGLYLDINLFKKVGSNDATKVTETKGKVKASIVIPESLWKSGRTFEIIRVHDGVATAIAGTYDENTHVFTFETDKFSTYALAYKDSAVAGSTTNSTQSTSPKTGDSNDIRVWYLLLIASLGGLGFLGYSKKKKVND